MAESPQDRYLREAALQISRAGFDISEQEADNFQVDFEGEKLCTVSGKDVRYRQENVEGNRQAAFQKMLDITHTVSEYMRLMEKSPPLQARGLQDHFKVLAEFNGILLAGKKYDRVPGHQFVTWERDYDGTGVSQGNYYDDYASAKKDFVTRSGLVQKGRQFSDAQLTEVYRCIHETLESDAIITPEREKLLRETAEQIENAVADLDQRVEESSQKELLYEERIAEGLIMR